MATKKDSINLAEYDEKRQVLAERMSKRPYGSQSAAAFDTRVAPTLISSVLGGKYISAKVLETIEAWLDRTDVDPNDGPARGAGSVNKSQEAVPA